MSRFWIDVRNKLHISRGNNPLKGLILDNESNVSIGNTAPNEKLTVKGTIHSEEVRVDLDVPAPDYVFEENYKLCTLEETEAYIKSHKRPPEIPSAEQIETNGVKLVEMNMLLLKKIEELTLYLIGQQKVIDRQQQKLLEIDTLKTGLKKLESSHR